jgi:hypothetical protein
MEGVFVVSRKYAVKVDETTEGVVWLLSKVKLTEDPRLEFSRISSSHRVLEHTSLVLEHTIASLSDHTENTGVVRKGLYLDNGRRVESGLPRRGIDEDCCRV